MAIYHLALQVIRRSEGRSAVAAAAYRTGQLLYDLRDGTRHDYTNKAVAEAFTLVPEGADWALDRERLWNAVEVAERRRKSTLAREWEVALPAELSDAARSELVRQFAQDLVDRYRVAADVGVHAPDSKGDSRNWHAHVLITTRVVTADGMGKKTRVLDDIATGPKEVEAVRALWAARANEALHRVIDNLVRDGRVTRVALSAAHKRLLRRGH
jgi:ATP-dependent exoDNAse (exonuclease V) alpha subunit